MNIEKLKELRTFYDYEEGQRKNYHIVSVPLNEILGAWYRLGWDKSDSSGIKETYYSGEWPYSIADTLDEIIRHKELRRFFSQTGGLTMDGIPYGYKVEAAGMDRWWGFASTIGGVEELITELEKCFFYDKVTVITVTFPDGELHDWQKLTVGQKMEAEESDMLASRRMLYMCPPLWCGRPLASI